MATPAELHIAYRRARERFGDAAWFELEMPIRIAEIEVELRSLPPETEEPRDLP
jgi:hypothetical protein